MTYLSLDVPTNLEQVIERLKANTRLDPTRKRDLIWAVSTTATMLQRRPAEITTSVPDLRGSLLALQPRRHGKTPKTMANIRANLAKALELTRAVPRPHPQTDPSPDWQAFLDKAPNRHNRYGLARFMRYCTVRRLEPSDVSDETLAQFQKHLDARLLTNDPRKVCISVAENWNVVIRSAENGGAKVGHGSGGMILLRAAE